MVAQQFSLSVFLKPSGCVSKKTCKQLLFICGSYSLLLFLLFACITPVVAQSCSCTFTSTGGTAGTPLNWNNAATWSTSGTGCAGKTLPGINDCVTIRNNDHVTLSGGSVFVLGVINNGNLNVTGSTARLNVGPYQAPDNKLYFISENGSRLSVTNGALVDIHGGWGNKNNGNTNAVGGTGGYFSVRSCGSVGANPTLFSTEGNCENINAPLTLAVATNLIYCIRCAACVTANPGQNVPGGGVQRQSSTSGCVDIVSILPIELISFEAQIQQGDENHETYVALKWATAREIDNDYFTIERSADGKDFDDIRQISGAGNSNSVIYYGTTDLQPLHGISYYRLKQTDFDGSISYSKIVSINVNTSCIARIMLYPNPYAGEYVGLKHIKPEELKQLAIYDAAGRLQAHCEGQKLTGTAAGIEWQYGKALLKGVYLLKIELTDGQQLTRRWIVN